MNAQTFFATHPVFTLREFDDFLAGAGKATENNRKRILAYHLQRGRLVRIRTGLYGVVPIGFDLATYPVDSFLIAARLTPDALIGYHSALAFQGVAHSRREERIVITKHPLPGPFSFQGVTYRTVLPPQPLVLAKKENLGVLQLERQGVTVRVTSLERALADNLDRPRLSGGWEEIERSYETVPYLDLDFVVCYALMLGNANTIASVGYFLQQQQERWMVSEEILAALRACRPRQPRYLDRHRGRPARLIEEWNLIVPEFILHRNWEEAHEHLA